MTVFQGRKREYIYIYTRGKRGGPGDRIGFNLLWLEFQNTRWLMHIAFGSVPTSLCGRTSATTFPSTASPHALPLARSLALTSPPLRSSSDGRKLILSSHQLTAAHTTHSPPPFLFSPSYSVQTIFMPR